MAIQIQLRRGTTTEWEATNPILAEGELGYDTTTGGFKVGNGVDDWTALSYNTGPVGAAGADGADGSLWYSGEGVPAGETGANGDYYLNVTNGDVYTKADGSWGIEGNIKGATGATGATGENGADGATWLSGAGDPNDINGANGDFYLNTTSYNVFKKAAGTWGSALLNIKGATGAAGADGTDGTDGADGATWLSGAVDPTTEGVVGDLYLNTTSYDVFIKTGGGWGSAVLNIKGVKGDTGATGSVSATTGITFEQIATPANPSSGYNKIYFKSDDKAYYLDSDGNETEVGSGSGGTITVQEVDGTPAVTPVDTIKFSNGTVTDNEDGSVSVVTNTGSVPAKLSDTTPKYIPLNLNRVPVKISDGSPYYIPLHA